ncbi:flavin-dependent thymidylate synthase [Pseudomonas phage TC6]|uniref:Flavin-dependent thymidylate synthase n=1 Tax=Pseudomonas phage TC6 TaxID=2060947 RepID=A0A2H5BQD0_9CAUD|nr:flavin-dependent thymidylate synthase [Pseudomonas phage TC6]
MAEIKVELVDSMGDDLRVANAARVSFNKWKEELDEGDVGLINYLARHEHSSPFRHTAITLSCKAPVFLARQLGKHQVGLSWNEVSRRYVDAGIEFFVPDNWRSRPDGSVKQGSGGVVEDNDMFKSIYSEYIKHSLATYENMLACNVATEQARMVLPQSMMVDWIWTGSLTAFFHAWRLRIDSHAQKEAQEFAQKLEEVVQPIFPHSWKALKNA